MLVKMKRLTLVAHKADEPDILSALQSLGAVEVLPAEAESGARALKQLEAAEQRVQTLSAALATLKPFAPKKGLLSPPVESTMQAIQADMPGAVSESAEIETLSHELSRARSEIEKNQGVIEQLRPWVNFASDMQTFQSAKTVKYFTGLLAASDEGKLEGLTEDSEYQILGDGAVEAVVVACPLDAAKSVAGFLKSLEWTDFAFPKMPGTPAAAIAQLEDENRRLSDLRGQLEQQLAAKGESAERIGGALDAAVIELDRAKAACELGQTAATFELQGWVREDQAQEVEQAIQKITDAYCLNVRDPEEDEIPPSVVQNNSFSTPFEQVTNLYSRPDPKGIDATPYMAPFYVLLFGLMLSDSGYGLILAIGCALYQKIKKPTGMSGGFVKVLFWGGLSTIVWGVLVGTVFGMDFDTLFGTVDKFPILVDPMGNPIGMLILCFGLGILHILFGVALKMKMAFAAGDWQTAIFDNLSWMLIVVGLILFAGTSALPTLPAVLSTIGAVMAIAGALMILLMKGRAKKNPFSRTISGLGELYQVTSYLSDILSYARLFALGIATGVIAQVFNDLCGMLMGSPNIILKILGILIAVALLVALHLFNIAINTLGAFVHCARLQYVEFYGKFYEAGGRAFQPLGYRTKHVRLTDR